MRFWDEAWQIIILEYLDRIIYAGFDGIYLDIIDAYEFFEDTIQQADWLMIDFVGIISTYVKSQTSNSFAVFVQNGDELLLNSTYLSYIDGIGREDLFYDDDDETDENWREEGIANLDIALNSQKAVLIIDYPISPEKILNFYQISTTSGYLPYATVRDLNILKEYSFYSPT